MPLHQLTSPSSSTLLGLWHATEPIEELRARLLSLRPGHEIPVFKADSRTREWLAARVLAYTLLEKLAAPAVLLQRKETGRPICSDAAWQISLTHSGPWVGALVSGSQQVGIDIEIRGDKVMRLASRFLTGEELAAAQDPAKLHLYWSAKETLYKVYRHKNLDFRENLRLQDFRLETAGCFEGRVFTGSFDRTYELHYELHPAFVLTYVLAPLEPEQRDL